MKKLLSLLLLGGIAAIALPAEAKIIHLLPRAQSVTGTGDSPFTLSRSVAIQTNESAADIDITALTDFFSEQGCAIDNEAEALVTISLVEEIDGAYDYTLEGFPNEGYTLEITADTIRITAITATGIVRAAQTLTQLAEGYDATPELEALTMTDWPAFKLRGFMHDVGRSFISVDEIKNEINLLSRFKVNVFHWHLTENQAWRFEVKAYPELTDASSMTRFAGSYYTQEECSEIEAYAAARGVIVIPEIDMPGHSEAFERAMGHSMQTDAGVEELQVILEEVAEAFPLAPYIHIGADEQTITYSGFLNTMISKVHELEKKVIVWNPISGVTITKSLGVDMTQMWSSSGNKVSGIPNIDCRYNYTNHFDVFADVVGIYKSSIYYQEKGDEEVAGFISAAWNDRKMPMQEDIIRQNNIYANILASTERAWIGGGEQYIEEGGTTLPNSGDEYDEFADWERRFLFHKANALKNEPIPYVKQSNVRWRVTEAFPNGGDATMEFPPETEGLKESYEYDNTTYTTGFATGAGIYLRHTWGTIVPAYFSNPQTNTTAYAFTYVYSPTARTAGALIEFQNYGRSETDTAPDEGNWDRKGSKLFVNDEEIMPPAWDNTGVTINNEVDLLNENFTGRPPELIELKEGWNKVLMRLPYNPTTGVRLTKWMFTFVLTDTLGIDALDDVRYSPDRCMDDAAEEVAMLLSDVKTYRNSVISATPGYYAASNAVELDSVITAVEATLQDKLSAEKRAAQVEALNEALEAFKAALETAELTMPKASTDEEEYAYLLSTPLRDGRYLSAASVGIITGVTTVSDATKWKFVLRDDDTYDIVNLSSDTYISPASSYNNAIYARSAQPDAGWTLSAADEIGYFIITCEDVQLNQTTSANNYRLFNWGSGTNTGDTGCKFLIEATTLPEDTEPVTIPAPVLTLVDLTFNGTTPYKIPEKQAEPLLASKTLSVAIDYTQPSSSDVSALSAATDTLADNNYLALVTMATRYGVRYNDSGGWYTQSATITDRHQMVIVMEAENIDYYLDGSYGRSVSGVSPMPTFYNVTDKNAIYLGGFATLSNNNKYPFTGTIHSARFYTEALTEEQVAALEYNDLVATAVNAVETTPNKEGNEEVIYNLNGQRLKEATRGVFIINGKKTVR